MKTAAEILLRLEADPNEKIIRKVPKDITIKSIEVNIQSAGISPKKEVFKTDDDQTKIPEQEIWQRKVDVRSTITGQPPVITIASYYHIDLPKKQSNIDLAHFNKHSRILIEQDSDPTFLNFKREMIELHLTSKYKSTMQVACTTPEMEHASFP